MRRRKTVAIVLALFVGACGGGGPAVTGIAADGEELFGRTVLAGNAGCVTCHSLQPDVVLVGPSLSAIGRDAASRRPNESARDYLRTSIVDPNAYVLEGFDAGRMPLDWEEQLRPEEIDALVEYLLTRGVDQ